MADTLEGLFLEISAKVSSFGEPIRSHICQIAAAEAKGKAVPFPTSRQSFIGIWDWDVPNDRIASIRVARLCLGRCRRCREGPNGVFIAGIHPHDLFNFGRLLSRA